MGRLVMEQVLSPRLDIILWTNLVWTNNEHVYTYLIQCMKTDSCG